MEEEKDAVSNVPAAPVKSGMSEETRGFIYAICSALCYTVSLSMLRCLTGYEGQGLSSDWSITMKELTTVGVILPFIAFQWIRGRYKFPTWGVFAMLVLAGITCQALGARSHLRAYAVIGLALATPLIQAMQLIMSSLFGAFWLKERVTKTKILALVILVVAVWLLSFKPQDPASAAEAASAAPTRLGLGLFLAALTALGYSSQLSIMRRVLRQKRTPESEPGSKGKNLYAPTTLSMVTVTGVGALICGCALTQQQGVSGWVPPQQICWLFVLISGVANMVGFYFQIEGLRRLFVLKQTMVANAQTISLTLVGILFYHEAFTWTMGLGVVMVAAGVALAGLEK